MTPRRTGMLLPPGHWCTVTFEGDGIRWPLTNLTEEWRMFELEYEAGQYRQRAGDGPWSMWAPIDAHPRPA
jgi:hypothetical protein